jgi:hypothetical protein
VSAVVIFLHLFMSGDVELHPGPQGEYSNVSSSYLYHFYAIMHVGLLAQESYNSTYSIHKIQLELIMLHLLLCSYSLLCRTIGYQGSKVCL